MMPSAQEMILKSQEILDSLSLEMKDKSPAEIIAYQTTLILLMLDNITEMHEGDEQVTFMANFIEGMLSTHQINSGFPYKESSQNTYTEQKLKTLCKIIVYLGGCFYPKVSADDKFNIINSIGILLVSMCIESNSKNKKEISTTAESIKKIIIERALALKDIQ